MSGLLRASFLSNFINIHHQTNQQHHRTTFLADGKYTEDRCGDTVDEAQVFVPVVTRKTVVNDRYGQLEDKERWCLKTQHQ